MLETYGSLVGAVWRAALPGTPAEAERDRAVLLTLATASEAVGEVVRCSLALFSRRARVAEPRTVKRSIARLIEAGLIVVYGEDVSISVEGVAALPREPAWSERLSGGGLGLCAGWKDPRSGEADTAPYRRVRHDTVRHDTVVSKAPYRSEYGTIPQSPGHDTVVSKAPYRTPYIVSLSDPNSDPLLDPPLPLPPTPHGQDEEEEAKGQEGELLTFAGDDVPLPTDADLALWGELVEAHTVDFFADSEPATVARPAAPSKPAQIEDPFVTAAREAPIKESSPAARELRASLERILALSIGRQQRGGIALDPLTALSLQSIVTGLMGKGATEEDALHAILVRLDEAGTKTSPLGWLRTVLLSPPRTAQEARNGGDRYPRQGGGGYGAQDAPKPSMKPLTDADLSPRSRWFQDHYGCLMDLRTYPLDFPFMSDSDRTVLEQFHADLKSGKIREEDIP